MWCGGGHRKIHASKRIFHEFSEFNVGKCVHLNTWKQKAMRLFNFSNKWILTADFIDSHEHSDGLFNSIDSSFSIKEHEVSCDIKIDSNGNIPLWSVCHNIHFRRKNNVYQITKLWLEYSTNDHLRWMLGIYFSISEFSL